MQRKKVYTFYEIIHFLTEKKKKFLFKTTCFYVQILVGSSLGGWLMLHAAIARPQKVVALIGVATAVDSLVTQFNQLPVEVSPRQPPCIPPVVLLLPL